MSPPARFPEPLEVAIYTPTPAFQAIRKHVAVVRARDGGVVAVVGPAGDAESERLAALFAAAGDMLDALDLAAETLAYPMSSTTRERVVERIRAVAQAARGGKVK